MLFKKKSADKPVAALSLIGPGTSIMGDLHAEGDVRIDGTLDGNLTGKARILIGPEGRITGDIHAKEADIMGTVMGQIFVQGLLYLHGKATVDGDIQAGQLQIDSTVSFNGQCRMGAPVVDMPKSLPKAVNE